MLAGGQMIRIGDAEHLDGGHTANVRYLWRQTFSVLAFGICEDDFSGFGPVKPRIIVLRPPANTIQFCRSGAAGISSWDNDVISVLENQISSSDSGEICEAEADY